MSNLAWHMHAAHPGAQNTTNREEASTARFLVITILLTVSISIYKIQFLTPTNGSHYWGYAIPIVCMGPY